MTENLIALPRGDDMHCHFRNGDILKDVLPHTVKQFGRAIAMPNTKPPVLTGKDANNYRNEIRKNCPFFERNEFEPLMTIKITDGTNTEMVREASKYGVVAGKVYPVGVTTNSEDGVSDFRSMYPVFAEMQKQGMLLLLHGEVPAPCFCMDREKEFLDTLYDLFKYFPSLRIVLEHITTREAVEAVKNLPENVRATITAHHLMITLDDVVGNMLNPHNFCKPIAKRPEDRNALREAATSGNPKFFYGGDSAPHPKHAKEDSHGCAGVFNAPVALPVLAEVFEEENALDKLPDFVGTFGAEFYGLQPNTGTVELKKTSWVVPKAYSGIVPFAAERILAWKVL